MQSFYIYKGAICKVFIFNSDLHENILNLLGTYLQSF